MTLRELFEQAKRGAVENFAKHGEVAPIALAITHNSEMVIPCGWGNRDERARIISALRTLFRIANVSAYAMINESWILEQTPGAKGEFVQPSSSERRREIISIAATDGNEKIMAMCDIIRPFDGAASLAPFTEDVNGDLAGELFSLLEEE